MTGPETGGSSEGRRKRLLFRAQRRGFKEVDLIFGTFAAGEIFTLSDVELDAFEALLEAPDQKVYDWFKGDAPVPVQYDSDIFRRLKALCARKNPTWSV